MAPADFIREYVDPAIQSFVGDPKARHLAAGAIAQLDVLAEVVWLKLCDRGDIQSDRPGKWRDELGQREPWIGMIRDAHDCHKHGRLERKSAIHARGGQRPIEAGGSSFFVSDGLLDLNFSGEADIYFIMDNGDRVPVRGLIFTARKAWERELTRLDF